LSMSRPLPMQVINPDTEFFSTPPSTPVAVGQPMHIPESWRNNTTRPSLQIDAGGRSDWNPDIELSTTSPPLTKTNGIQTAPSMAQDPTIVQEPPSVTPPSDSQNHKLINSPCFVHSHLDKGTLLSDWLRNKHHVECSDVGVAKSLQHLNSPAQSDFKSGNDSNDENEFIGSLTKQLADTAVGVREMSKQLGTFLPLFQHYILIIF
jgi:NAD+ kinase